MFKNAFGILCSQFCLQSLYLPLIYLCYLLVNPVERIHCCHIFLCCLYAKLLRRRWHNEHLIILAAVELRRGNKLLYRVALARTWLADDEHKKMREQILSLRLRKLHTFTARGHASYNLKLKLLINAWTVFNPQWSAKGAIWNVLKGSVDHWDLEQTESSKCVNTSHVTKLLEHFYEWSVEYVLPVKVVPLW